MNQLAEHQMVGRKMSEVVGEIVIEAPSRTSVHGQVIRAMVRREENYKLALHIARNVFKNGSSLDQSSIALDAINLALSDAPSGVVAKELADIAWDMGCPAIVIEADTEVPA